jgi:hypothetical protein
VQSNGTVSGGPLGSGVAVGVGVPAATDGVGVGVAVGKLTTTAADPVLQIVTLQAVISTLNDVFWLKVVANEVDPGGTGAGSPFTLQRVVV